MLIKCVVHFVWRWARRARPRLEMMELKLRSIEGIHGTPYLDTNVSINPSLRKRGLLLCLFHISSFVFALFMSGYIFDKYICVGNCYTKNTC